MSARQSWLVPTTEYAGLTQYTGGIGGHYAALLPALVARGVDVDLMVMPDAPTGPRADLHGVNLVTVRSTAGLSEMAALRARPRWVREVFDAGSYDRVFAPEWSALGSALPRGAPLVTNLATSTAVAHEVSGLRLRDLPKARRLPVAMQMRRESRQIHRSQALIAISTAMLQRTQAAYHRLPPAAVVANCIDVPAVRAAAAAASLPSGWPEGDGPIVLFLGRRERRKGIVEALTAFGEVHEARPRARLVVAGAGGDDRFEPSRTDLLALLPDPARNRVTWLGHVAGAELYRALRIADVVLCPSRWEGFGQVALEAKAAGSPLVVTSGSGFDDFCVDGVDCLMVAPRDPGALASATLRLLDDRGLADALAARAGARVEAFAADPIARDLLATVDRLLGVG